IFATTPVRDARGQPHADVDGDASREKWKRPFRKKLPLQYLKRSVICKARNFQKPGSARVSRVGLGVSPKQSLQYMSILRRRARNTRTSVNAHAQRVLHHFDNRPSGTAGIASPASA